MSSVSAWLASEEEEEVVRWGSARWRHQRTREREKGEKREREREADESEEEEEEGDSLRRRRRLMHGGRRGRSLAAGETPPPHGKGDSC